MKTKSLISLCILACFVLVLSACGSNASNTTSNQSAGSASLSEVNMLLVGTLKLEGTDQAVSADEAAKLLPLWQAYRSLSTSQTAAQEEVDGLLKQIQSSMTSQQVQAIEAMNLTNKDMMDLMQSMGAVMGPRGTPNPQGTPGVDFPSGGFQMGNPPDMPSGGSGSDSSGGTRRNMPQGGEGPFIIQGGPGMGGDAGSAAGLGQGQVLQGTPDPSMQATAQARFTTQASQVNSILLNVLINKLDAMTSQ